MSARLPLAIAFSALLVGVAAAPTLAGPNDGQRCAASKLKAAGKKASCLLGLDAKTAAGITVDPLKVQKCKDKLGDPVKGTFARAEAKGGCVIEGDAATIEGKVDNVVDDVFTALNVGTPSICQSKKLKATGKKAECLLTLQAKAASGAGLDADRVQQCKDTLSAVFASLDAGGTCATSGDAATIEGKVDGFVDDVVAAIPSVATCAIAGCPAAVVCDTGAGACWQPALTERWQYQLQGAQDAMGNCRFAATGGIDVGIDAPPFGGGAAVAPAVFDIDLLMDPVCAPGGSNDVDNGAAVSAIHTDGDHVLCYVSAGTYEPFRPDAQSYVDFDQACGNCLIGKPVAGFRDEHWLDIRDDQGQRTFILSKLAARVDRCKADGFDAVEFDNVEGYANSSGFPLSDGDQLVFNSSLANLAHARGLTAALKNDLGQVTELLSYFDMAVNEQCQQFDECAALDPFIGAGKAVFQVEYEVPPSGFCAAANGANRSAIAKTVDLFDTPWTSCR
jgi:hypothetical protein